MNLEYWRTYVDEIEATPVDALLGRSSPAVRTALEHALAEKRVDARRGAAALHVGRRRPARDGEVRGPRARRGYRRRSHLRRQSQYQLHQYLFRRMPVLRLQAPALGGRRLRSFRPGDRQQSCRRGRARRDRNLHAGRNQPRDAAVQVSRPARRDEGRVPRDSHPRLLADGNNVRRQARADGLPGIHHDAQGARASARFRAPRRKSSTTACARS